MCYWYGTMISCAHLPACRYDVVLTTVDKYGNDCTKGGATVVGRIMGQNLPPGQEIGTPISDLGDGKYSIRLYLRANAEIKLHVIIARDGQTLSKLEVSDLRALL